MSRDAYQDILEAGGAKDHGDVVRDAVVRLSRVVELVEADTDRDSRLDPVLKLLEDVATLQALAQSGDRVGAVEALLSRLTAIRGMARHVASIRRALAEHAKRAKQAGPGGRVLPMQAPVGAEHKPDPGVWARLEKRPGADGMFRPKKCLLNVLTILRDDPRWNGRVIFNRLTQRREIADSDLGVVSETPTYRALSDVDEVRAAVWMSQVYALDCATQMVGEALSVIAEDAGYHPVQDYLGRATWDGRVRIDTWLTVYLGADDTPLHRAYARKWLISAVARAMDPGCKVDTVLILVGEQGLKKSSAFRALCHDPTWFTDTVFDVNSKDAYQTVATSWIVEMAELDSLKRGTARETAIKAFLSARVDKFRPPYGRHQVDHPRQAVMVGSSNPDDFLDDATGSRRFWPVRVHRVTIHDLIRDRDQIWAEAMAAYRAKEKWWLGADEEAQRTAEAEEFKSLDPWTPLIAEWLERQPGWFTTAEVMRSALDFPRERMSKDNERRVTAVLKGLGCEAGRYRDLGLQVRAWRRKLVT